MQSYLICCYSQGTPQISRNLGMGPWLTKMDGKCGVVWLVLKAPGIGLTLPGIWAPAGAPECLA